MRWFLPIILLSLARPAFAQENEAEKLFRAMEKRISEAKSLKVTIEIDSNAGGEFGRAKGSVAIGEGNKFNLEVQGTSDDRACRILMICDGKNVCLKASLGASDSSEKLAPASANRNKALLVAAPRMGFFLLGCLPPHVDTEYIKRDAHVSDFHIGGNEQVNGIPCQIVHYRLGTNEARDADGYSAKVWIDEKTALPTKFHLRRNDGNSVCHNEVIVELILNPKLDPQLFELPK